MRASSFPYKRLIFVCTNSRPSGQRISCAGDGRCGQEILERLKEYVKVNHLEDKVRVARSGCQEKCEDGPNMAVMPQNDYLSGLSLTDVDAIIEKYLVPLVHEEESNPVVPSL